MKVTSFSLAAVCLYALTLLSCDSQKKKIKAQVVKECIESGDSQFTEPKIRQMFHEYCECSGEKTSEKFSNEEWKEFVKMKKEHRDAEMQEKLLPIIQPCLDELKNKISKTAQ